jgi:hypothetical protein
MSAGRDGPLFSKFTGHCEDARAALRKHMAEQGLRPEDGWRIHEFTRESDGHTELVMRPVHRDLTSELECACSIDRAGTSVSSECREP